MRITSRLRDTTRTSSLNNLLPEDNESQASEDVSMSGICIQTEHVSVPIEPVNGHHKRLSCEASCSGGLIDQKHSQSNKQQNSSAVIKVTITPDNTLNADNVTSGNAATSVNGVPDNKEVADSYEITL